MRDMSYIEAMGPATRRLTHRGAFLCVPGDNVMTIGWGAFGFFWGMPILTVAVRPSRYTYELIEKAGRFIVSVPGGEDDLKEALALAGSLSGRDGDKFDRCKISRAPGRFIDCPSVLECPLNIECVTRLRQDMTSECMDANVIKRAYPMGDLHRMYFGEILGCYER